MGTTYRFLATVDEGVAVLDWFRSLPEPPTESPRPAGAVFYFRDCGQLQPEPSRSPIVNVFLPVRRRGALTTIGEVHFLATPLSAFPKLNGVSKQFRKWLGKHACVFSRRPGFSSEWNYYLEGSIRNWDSDIFALTNGLAAIRSGEYFISEDDNGRLLDVVCQQLKLRGVAVSERAEQDAAADRGNGN
jgi:hypothetical protein